MKLIISELDGGEVAHYAIREDGDLVDVDLVWDGKRTTFVAEYGKPATHDVKHVGVFTDARGERLFYVDMETRDVREIFDEFSQNV